MFWKNWPYWLKGGFYGGIFLFIFGFLNSLRIAPSSWSLLTNIINSFIYGLLFLLGGIFLGIIGSFTGSYLRKRNFAFWLIGGILAVLFTVLYFGFFLIFGRGPAGIMGGFILIPILAVVYGIPIFLIGALIGLIYGKIKNKKVI